ncbi:hypothetical protein [Sandaracinus amylolyticus]|uniref:Uncharacterized protein n=1 Tax=Sandaracinus amylolyticus TaxID=927083 RepID=A0A0F6W577_9BACT|nr:hypothetical protein [Sandaracinus amylolyticus]AKF07730.1 hypothetical protein DB32_004879 [Sandaracinus amylolyticus]
MQTTLAHDTITAARATWGVASSPPMPRWREYMAWIEARRADAERFNAGEIALERALVALVTRAPGSAPYDALPWLDASEGPPSRRLYSALVSFVDDYEGPFPAELFPRDEVHALRRALCAQGRALTIDEQLAIALEHTAGRTFAAAILLHAVMRLVARDRDARALGSLEWDERLRDASWIAPFAPSVAGDGDAPGDTYHYWANFVVGFHAALHGRVAPRALGAAFYLGPIAMRWIREGVFGSELFAGAHTECDRMGLRHGRAVARAITRSR